MLRKLVIVALAMLPSVLLAGQPVQDIEAQSVGVKVDGSAFSTDEVKGAIVQACHGRGWTPRLEANDTVVASILVRGRHFAEVEIPFDPRHFRSDTAQVATSTTMRSGARSIATTTSGSCSCPAISDRS